MNFFSVFLNLFFNWRKIALQCCVGFCHTTMQISHKGVCVCMYPLTLVPPSNPSPLSHHRALGWTPCCCSVTKLCPTLCNPMSCSTPGFPVLHYLLAFTQTRVHWVGDAIQPSHPVSSPSPAFNLFQHQGLLQWVSSSDQVAKILAFQLQHQSFQWRFRVDFL